MTASATLPLPQLDPENTLYLDLPDGRVVIQLRPDLAPKHVARIKELVRKGFYDGLTFHRVIPGFMAQTGDPRGDGTGGSGQKLKAEFSNEHHIRGTVSMARAGDPNSADSQFFICFAPSSWLDGQYTIWGQVVSGMEFVDKIKSGDKNDNGRVENPTKIVKAQIAADVKG
jgi:peptidylprolyl isomerase